MTSWRQWHDFSLLTRSKKHPKVKTQAKERLGKRKLGKPAKPAKPPKAKP
jgi:hypothetical protein